MRRLIIALTALFVMSYVQAAQVDTVLVNSRSMQKDIKTVVIIPDVAAEKPCPVIYLLHGHGNDYSGWIRVKPNLPQITDEKGIIFICPDGERSWYWDSPLNKNVRYETFISSELIAYVDSHYKTIARREGRAITGLSMGGHGAMWNAIRHSDVFGAAGSTSGGVDIRPFPKNWDMSKQLGEEAENQSVWDAHTVINLVPSMKKGQLAMIIDCGYGDFFLEVNKNFHEALLKQGIDHDFLLRPGEHNSTYWNNSIDYQILFFQKYFQKNGINQ